MAAPRKYPDELRERATRLAVEAGHDHDGRGQDRHAHPPDQHCCSDRLNSPSTG